jgi:agmatinase
MGVKSVKFDDAGVIILPVPYEGTVSYGTGTGEGPGAIISASKHVELYDEEMDFEPYIWGIHILSEMDLESQDPHDMFQSVRKMGEKLATSGRLIIMLGGEHSITPGMVSAFAERYDSLSVLQLDAHADLRNQYNGSLYNHACAMRRVLEKCPAVQVGIRSLSCQEKRLIDRLKLPVFLMNHMRENTDWMTEAVEALSENVYITIDVDVFDPSIMPSTGTPEPGGMLWYETLKFLRKVSEKRNILAFDVVELSPKQDNPAPDFMTAKLIYKLMGYIFNQKRSSKGKSEEKLNLTDRRLTEMAEVNENSDLSYVLQITDFPDRFKCAMKVDPGEFGTFEELLDRYVKIIHEKNMTSKSAKNLSVIQDCIYKIDDDGELLDLYEGLVLRQGDNIVDLHDEPHFQRVHAENYPNLMLIDLIINRSQITEEGNPYGYNIRKWDKKSSLFEGFIHECLTESYGSQADRIMEVSNTEDQKRFLRAVGKKIWESDFELYSRFIGDKLWFKDPSETLTNIIAGRGGTCAEKTSAMKMISDVYGFECEYILGGPGARGPFPADVLSEMLETFDFELGKKYMAYWEHMALLYDLEVEDVMMDVTNGNVPFLFLTGGDIEELLRENNKKSVKVKMVLKEEEFYYHVTPQDIPQMLLEAMQDWIDDIDLIHVFDDGLGLLIRKDYYVWPVMYRDEDEKMSEYNWWLELKEKQDFPAVELLDNFSLPGPVVNAFKEKYPQKFVDIVDAYEYLVKRYNESYREPDDELNYNMAYMFLKLS